MNVDILNSKYKVVSKYFVGKTVMDESLSDFKEKKSFKVKNNKAPPAKPKAKKVKQVKGQKDIRAVLKAKKNELIAYSEDFDAVCKKSGIDVDSEQLQLAIALSKSLQTTDSVDSSSSSSKSLTTQQRTGLIRTTLKEYGFRVPEKPTTSRKTKKRRKPYKLLLTSEEEKQQIISDRYSQLLFELNNLESTSCDKDLVLPNLFIYNMSTNIEYENIKDDAIFYVENIIEESPNSMGCLLKNWSDIPGRPSSPDVNRSELLFSEVECSQEELDIVLSGPLKNSKDIFRKKNMLKDRGRSPVKTNICKTVIEFSPEFVKDNTGHQSPVFIAGTSANEVTNADDHKYLTNVGNREEKHLPMATQPSRSLSPDLFDDEDDTVVEIPNETVTETDTETANNFTKQASEVMDLTECINAQKNMYNISNMKSLSQISQQINVTKRQSNDFMEMTECVGSSSQHLMDKIDEEIDLTGPCENIFTTVKNSTHVGNAVLIECDGDSPLLIRKEDDKHIDLTAECEKNTETEKNIKRSCTKNLQMTNTIIFLEDRTAEHIDLTQPSVGDMENKNNSVNADNVEHLDLTQSSNTSGDSLPFVQVGGTQAVPEKSLDDTIILNENDYLETKSPEDNKKLHVSDDEQLNQEPNIVSPGHAIEIISPKHKSVVTHEAQIINLDESEVPEVNDDKVDLTQTSDSNEANNISQNHNHINNSSLGKKDDVSVDYDEALENMNSFPYYDNDTIVTEDHLEKSNDNEAFSNSKLLEPSINLNSSVIMANDNEVLSHSKVHEPSNDLDSPSTNIDNYFDFGGISVIDNLHSFNNKSRHTNSLPNGSMRDSLPMVDVKGSGKPKSPLKYINPADPISHKSLNEKPIEVTTQTPKTNVNKHVNVETPEQSEYIVKTDNVTPMLDYASMSTPERNRELDKYGLKPFKRKRAIQLLTHLYNQTHPYVESTEELPSPSKKRRTENLSQPSPSKSSSSTSISLRKATKSPIKASKSPRKSEDGNLNNSDKENDLFMVTRELPVIRNIECDADDWVFQKREKAKLQTCRVPLHIAFHNYVSCRLRLHEAILRYEPVNIDVIHKELAASGHRYDPKDLLKFLDKRCITVKTADNTKTNKRY
ncbi:structure-specific endonuclease subunit SLX4 [Cydia pomonella]|uniref:structure-specific endonuclease subunit SLX4 n=1 Tax=Cydia pomonella TaxID=82600 RepID=UPI002ADDDE70|nr:structure-specific endonuclease subunit SLX4 [Cydia pomonella]